MRSPQWIAVSTLLLLSSGCDILAPDLEVGCTSEPCPDGLYVELLGELSAEYSLAVTAEFPDVSYQPWVQYCNPEQDCDLVGQFPNFDPEELTLTYTSANTVVVKTVGPEYRVGERGEKCGGDCRFASIEMRVSD